MKIKWKWIVKRKKMKSINKAQLKNKQLFLQRIKRNQSWMFSEIKWKEKNPGRAWGSVYLSVCLSVCLSVSAVCLGVAHWISINDTGKSLGQSVRSGSIFAVIIRLWIWGCSSAGMNARWRTMPFSCSWTRKKEALGKRFCSWKAQKNTSWTTVHWGAKKVVAEQVE